MSGNKIIKSVSFNLTNKEDVNMLNAIKRLNFSGYVKELILADIAMKNSSEVKSESIAMPDVEKEETPKEITRDDILKRLVEERKKAALERAAKDKGD